MKSDDDRLLRWRCRVVDVLIAASTLAMVLAATDATPGHGYVLPTLASVAFLGVALIVEPGDPARRAHGNLWHALRSLRGRLRSSWLVHHTT